MIALIEIKDISEALIKRVEKSNEEYQKLRARLYKAEFTIKAIHNLTWEENCEYGCQVYDLTNSYFASKEEDGRSETIKR